MNNERRFKDILKEFTNAMLVTQSQRGPHARPMRIIDVTDSAEVWFVTDRHSAKIAELDTNPNILITAQSGAKFLTLGGAAIQVDDQQRIEQLWSEPWKIWFPEGKNDPSITLIRILPETGELWDNSGTNRIRYLYEAGKAYFQSKQLDPSDLDVHAKVQL